MHPVALRLYRLLCLRTDPVRIVEQDEQSTRPTRTGSTDEPRKDLPPAGTGFLIHCPLCGGWQCLYVCARYGLFDPTTGSDNLDLAVCRRNDCVYDAATRMELAAWVFRGDTAVWPGTGTIVPTAEEAAQFDVLAEVPLPGDIVPVNELSPMHPAAAYLSKRGYDLDELATTWGVGYCTASSHRMLRGRIYIPVYRGGILVGWQGRWPADLNWNEVGFKKYYSGPGLRKSQLLYNQDLAARQPLVVVCEGVSDVWSVGAPGVALLGKTASTQQLRLLAGNWVGKPAVVLLDADAEADAGRLFEELRPLFGRRLVLAVLPEGLDPGGCPRRALWTFIRARAAQQGVTLPDVTSATPAGP
jgi:hypothetical protein